MQTRTAIQMITAMLLFGYAHSAVASASSSLINQKMNLAASQKAKKESRLTWGSTVAYAARQDLGQDREPLLTTHRVAMGVSLTLLDRPVLNALDEELANELATFSLGGSAQALAVGNELNSQSTSGANSGPVEIADLDLSVSRNVKTRSLFGAKSTLEFSLGTAIPTSEASQYEGYKAVPYFGVTSTLSFQGGRYNLVQGLSADYVVNTYDYSPVTREINSDTTGGYTVSAGIRLGAGFKFSASGSARLVHHFDDTVTSALGNTQALSWSKDKITISLKHVNGSRPEDRESTLWFVDEYRRVVSLGLMARF